MPRCWHLRVLYLILFIRWWFIRWCNLCFLKLPTTSSKLKLINPSRARLFESKFGPTNASMNDPPTFSSADAAPRLQSSSHLGFAFVNVSLIWLNREYAGLSILNFTLFSFILSSISWLNWHIRAYARDYLRVRWFGLKPALWFTRFHSSAPSLRYFSLIWLNLQISSLLLLNFILCRFILPNISWLNLPNPSRKERDCSRVKIDSILIYLLLILY